MEQVRAVVHGLVQGVGFRYHTQRVAQGLGVVGCVRNLADGTVEIVAMGNTAQVNALLEWANQGPPSARVSRVEVAPYGEAMTFDRFTIEG